MQERNILSAIKIHIITIMSRVNNSALFIFSRTCHVR